MIGKRCICMELSTCYVLRYRTHESGGAANLERGCIRLSCLSMCLSLCGLVICISVISPLTTINLSRPLWVSTSHESGLYRISHSSIHSS